MDAGSRGRRYFRSILIWLCVVIPCQLAVAQGPARQTDDAFVWAAIRDSTNRTDFETFLRLHPKSPLAPLAAARIEQLSNTQTTSNVRADGPRRYLYRNSNKPVDPRGSPVSGDRMHVRLEFPTTAVPSFIELDDERFLAMCADEDGCKLTVSFIGWVDGGRVLPTPTTTGSCRLFIRVLQGRRHWQLDRGCTKWFAGWSYSNEKNEPVWRSQKPEFFAPYHSLTYGIDGVDTVQSLEDDRGWVVFVSGCGVAESPPLMTSTNGAVVQDSGPGFFFIAGTKGWAGRSWPENWASGASGRACELLVED